MGSEAVMCGEEKALDSLGAEFLSPEHLRWYEGEERDNVLCNHALNLLREISAQRPSVNSAGFLWVWG